MSAQATTSPKIQISPEKVNEYRAKARRDAKNDPVGAENCQGWQGSLQQIANDVAQQMGDAFMHFKNKCDEARKKAGDSHNDINAKLAPGFVDALNAGANQRMGAATANVLVGLKKDADLMHRYRERFPNLVAHEIEPHKANKWFFGGSAIILIAIESLANSRLFAEADDFGLVGGALLAILVSCVNVLPMLFAGVFATKSRGNIDMPLWVWRAICVGALIVAVAVNIGILAIRDYKIAAAGGVSDPSQSGLLFAIGIIIAGAAFYKGWKFPDLYAKIRECQERIERDKTRYFSQVLGPIEREIEGLQSAKATLQSEIAQLEAAAHEWHNDSPIIALNAVSEVKRVWQIYDGDYAPLHRDPDPVLPQITLTNADKWGVHIHDSWNQYADRMSQFAEKKTGELNGLLQAIEELIKALIALKNNLVSVITADINNACPS